MPSRTIMLTLVDDEREYQVDVIEDGPFREARVEQRVYTVTPDGRGSLRIASDRTTTAWTVVAGEVRWVFVDGRGYELTEARPRERAPSGGHHGSLTAPMPATVLRVLVTVGDGVKRGDTLVILEAMKMELPVRTGVAGKVRAVHCREGELVQPGLALIEIDEE
jgi:biotin carboxyl carrier protein